MKLFLREPLVISFFRQDKQDCQDKKYKEIVTMQVHLVNPAKKAPPEAAN